MIDLTPVLKTYARRRVAALAREDAAANQERLLRRIVRAAKTTRFGRDHGFERISTMRDFQRQVPLRRYEAFWRQYWGPAFPYLDGVTWPGRIPFFALSSGTTSGVTKYIPYTKALQAKNALAGLDLLCLHVLDYPQSRLFSGRSFMLGGSTALRELGEGVLAGDLSGIAATMHPWWLRGRYFPPRELANLGDWEEKIARLAPASLDADLRSLGGTTSWLLLFFERLADLYPDRPRRLASFYPDLELVVHGGVSFAPYRTRFAEWTAGSRAVTREVYPASEGFIALADRSDDDGLRLLTDRGLVFEFVPVEELDSPAPTRHTVADLELGVNYALVLSSCAGLWAYVIGDTVRFIERDPPRLLVTGRTSYMLSAFGEHLIGEEIDHAVTEAASAVRRHVSDYACGAVLPAAGDPRGRHVYVIEFDTPADEDAVRIFAAVLDGTLKKRNEDYEAHRRGDVQMAPPLIEPVPAGTFEAWMKSRRKLGGQNKVPRVINDSKLLEALRRFARERA